jgi:hypothetical protein
MVLLLSVGAFCHGFVVNQQTRPYWLGFEAGSSSVKDGMYI